MTSTARSPGDSPQVTQQEPGVLILSTLLIPPRLLLTCALFTREGQLVIAGNVIPLALLMPDHHHAVLPSGKEVVWLVGAPVLKLLWVGVGKG